MNHFEVYVHCIEYSNRNIYRVTVIFHSFYCTFFLAGMMSSQRRKMERRMMMEMDFPMKKDMMRMGMNRMRPPRGMMDEMDRDMYEDMHEDMPYGDRK